MTCGSPSCFTSQNTSTTILSNFGQLSCPTRERRIWRWPLTMNSAKASGTNFLPWWSNRSRRILLRESLRSFSAILALLKESKGFSQLLSLWTPTKSISNMEEYSQLVELIMYILAEPSQIGNLSSKRQQLFLNMMLMVNSKGMSKMWHKYY